MHRKTALKTLGFQPWRELYPQMILNSAVQDERLGGGGYPSEGPARSRSRRRKIEYFVMAVTASRRALWQLKCHRIYRNQDKERQ
jgi:hypothetical protein